MGGSFMINQTDGNAYLAYVSEKIKNRLLALKETLLQGQQEIHDMHDYYWGNYTEMDEYGYENYDNQQALLQQVNANQAALQKQQHLKHMLDAPFFGRIDFQYEGEEEPESFYIGIGTFAERNGALPLIYDWRSPVSSLFYDYEKGPASYEAPGGTMSGEITARWQYKIRGGKMVYAFESDVKINDDILRAELGSSGEVQLKNIIRTIQKEQNAIIRNTKDRILVIQGAAGSGKTSVALHRIAYLLYHDRKNLKSSNVLILSPNGVFSDYISHILPELGEEAIQEMSFDVFAYRKLRDIAADCEDRWDQTERLLHGAADSPSLIWKQSSDFLREMEGFLLSLEDDLMNFREIEYRGTIYSPDKICHLFYEKLADIPLLSRMDEIAEFFIDEAETLLNKDLPDEAKEELHEKFRRMYGTMDLYRLYNRFLKEQGFDPLPDVPLEKRTIAYEDVYPLLYLKYRLLRQKERTGIKHLIVDEMQDYTRLQYTILRQMFSCRMTILGDRAQTIDQEPRDVLKFLPSIFGRDIHRIEMKKSYRNTTEIAAYASQILGITDLELYERHGKPVETNHVSSFEEALTRALASLDLSDRYETAAILLPCADDAAAVYGQLKNHPAFQMPDGMTLSLLDRNSIHFRKGLTVTTYYLAKGLEFDQVFGIFPADDDRPIMRQAKYITATRALHELYLYLYKEK